MFDFITLSSLEKVFPQYTPPGNEYTRATMLQNEVFSFQIAYRSTPDGDWRRKRTFDITVISPLSDVITLREVVFIPSEYPAARQTGDDDILSTDAGLFPDLLVPLPKPCIETVKNTWHSLWVTVSPNGAYPPGEYPVKLVFTSEDERIEKTFSLTVIGSSLPKQELIFTNWFHADCIASVYGVRVFSEKHWELIGKFMRAAHDSGVNMILTPLFTPPLDTEPGAERPTVQLVGVTKTDGGYSFDFSLLDRWVSLAEDCGIRYFEMSHLFTQWGAKAAPKIIATVGGRKKRIFGWDTPADSEKYKAFLAAFLPELCGHLKSLGISERTVFHISDEPSGDEQLRSYLSAKAEVAPYIGGAKIIDALSHIDFYLSGAVEHPISDTSVIEPFLSEDIPDRWAYYCSGCTKGVSNQFFGYPSARNRVIGAQLFKYNISGFLHWGFDFYYSALSREVIDPFLTTDAKAAFPSGDAFRVYPGKDGPLESLRLCVFRDALTDLRAMRLLGSYIGHEEVVKTAEKHLGKIAFTMAPVTAENILALREEINGKIDECAKKAANDRKRK